MTSNFLSKSINRSNPDSIESLNLPIDDSTSINSNPITMTPKPPPAGNPSKTSTGLLKVPKGATVIDATDSNTPPNSLMVNAKTNMVTKPPEILQPTHDLGQQTFTTPRRKTLPKNSYHPNKGITKEYWRLNSFDEFKVFI